MVDIGDDSFRGQALDWGSLDMVGRSILPRPSAMPFPPFREFEDISNASFHLDMW